uniref:Putative ovule protein n=1 Tax=Solanum chacoense TaxID=4108 RepID=A0A0V0HJ34_SOLCH
MFVCFFDKVFLMKNIILLRCSPAHDSQLLISKSVTNKPKFHDTAPNYSSLVTYQAIVKKSRAHAK